MTRIKQLDGVHNFRHFHGYDAADGAKVREGLFRSGHQSRASEADRAVFEELGIKVVADLRKRRERDNEPFDWPAHVRVIASEQGNSGEPPHLAFLRKGIHTEEAVRDYMMSAYRRIPMEACNQEVYREAYKALASGEADSGFLVHCAAGKDRTGIFCALILDELGVDHDAIVEDYLLTNKAVNFDEIIPRIQERVRSEDGQPMPAAMMQVFLGVDGDYLEEAFRTMGSTDQYVTEQLGITEAERQALRQRWLA
jgi:protein-tyrosine phosphatase